MDPRTFPFRLPRAAEWRAEDTLILEAENTADFMVNLHVVFRGAGREVRARMGLFPHWPCRIPVPLATASGRRLFLERTPGRFKTTVGGANLDFSALEEIVVTVSDGAQDVVRLDRAEVSRERPTAYTMPAAPLVDGLHQWRARDWPGKARNIAEVRSALEAELSAPEPAFPKEWSRFGGWTGRRFAATGFFRTEHDGRRWWLVDPEGHAFWSMGCNCIRPFADVNTTGIGSVFDPPLPKPAAAPHLWQERNGQRLFNALGHNLERALGPDWRDRWMTLTGRRLRAYGFNTIANWSDRDLPARCGVPTVFTLRDFPGTERMIFRDFPDVFAPEFEANARAFAAQLEPYRTDPALIGYFMNNEPQWAFVSGFDLGEQLLRSDEPSATRAELIAELRRKYDSIAALNAAWGSDFAAFDDLNRASPPERHPRSGPDTLAFTARAVERYVRVPADACRAADPNHLNLGLRWAWIHSDYQWAGADALGAFSINQYQLRPDAGAIARLSAKTGRPVLIGEFHIGALDRGLPSGGIRNARTMAESVRAYRYYIEQAAAVPELVGAHYFQWNDQHVMGRFDGENMQIGLHDITGRAYPEWVEICRAVHPGLYRIVNGEAPPFNETPAVVPQGTLVW